MAVKQNDATGSAQGKRPQQAISEEMRQNITTLVDMGFLHEQAETALRKTSNNLERAIEWIVSNIESASGVDDDMITHADDDGPPPLIPADQSDLQSRPTWGIGSTASFSDSISGVSTTGQIAAAQSAINIPIVDTSKLEDVIIVPDESNDATMIDQDEESRQSSVDFAAEQQEGEGEGATLADETAAAPGANFTPRLFNNAWSRSIIPQRQLKGLHQKRRGNPSRSAAAPINTNLQSRPSAALAPLAITDKSTTTSTTKSNTYEDDLSKAIEMSLQEQQSQAQETVNRPPDQLLRENLALPPGLRNVGNTCYVNSILQTYFQIPKFRHFVLSYRADSHESKAEPFLLELQRLFAQMLLTERKVADPTALLEAMNKNGVVVRVGQQDDLTAFMDNLLSRIEEVLLAPAKPAAASAAVAKPVEPKEEEDAKTDDEQEATSMEIDSPLRAPQEESNADASDPSQRPLKKIKQADGSSSSSSPSALSSPQQQVASAVSDESESAAKQQVATSSCVTKDLFYGRQVELIDSKMQSGEPVQVKSEQEYCALIVNVSNELNSLYRSLDHLTTQEQVDYRTDFQTQAIKSTWLTKIPPVLVIQVQRTAFDQASKQASKLQTAFEFPKTLVLERYLERNKAETLARRARVQQMLDQVANLQKQLEQAQNYENKHVAIDDMFRMCASFLSQNSALLLSQDVLGSALHPQQIVEALSAVERTLVKQFDATKSEIGNINNIISHLYDDMDEHGQQYVLHSTLVHEGLSLDSGHYWNYLNVDWNSASQQEKSRWLKFNDASVSECSEEEVWERSTGGRVTSTAAAYCLLYVHRDAVAVADPSLEFWKSLIPEQLVQEIEQDNANLHQALRDYEEAKQRRALEQDEAFKRNYLDQLAAMVAEKEQPPSYSIQNDERISNFAKYLGSIGEDEAMRLALAEQVFCQTFELPSFAALRPDLQSPEVTAHFFKLLEDIQIKIAVDLETMISLGREHGRFVDVARYLCAALDLITKKEVDIAIEALQVSLVLDAQLRFTAVKRRDEIVSYLALCANEFYQKTTQQIFYSRDIQMARYFFSCCLNLLPFIVAPHTRAFIEHIKSDFVKEANRFISDFWRGLDDKNVLREMIKEVEAIDVDDLFVRSPLPPAAPNTTHSFNMSDVPLDPCAVKERVGKLAQDVENSNTFFFGSRLQRGKPQSYVSSLSAPTWSDHNNKFSVLSNNDRFT